MTSDDPACTNETPVGRYGGPASNALSRISRLHRIAAGKLLQSSGLYPGQEFLMMRLWNADSVRQSELIKSMDLDPSTVTKMLQRLDQAGYVKRSPDPQDRRAVLVEATKDSCALRWEVKGACDELEEQTLAGLDADERRELTRLLAKVESNLCAQVGECADGGPRKPGGRQSAATPAVRETSA